MPSSDVSTILIDLLRQHIANPWLIAIIVLLVAVGGAVGAAIGGAFTKSYVSKLAEHLATRKNFDELLDQLRATTSVTYEIRERLSSQTWRTQQYWSSRERYYSQLLTQLHHFNIALSDLASDYFMEQGTENMPDSERGEPFHKLLADASAANKEIERLVGPAALFLSAGAVEALDELVKKHWGLANFEATCTADYVSGAHRLVSAAYEHVLQEARTQLSIEGDA